MTLLIQFIHFFILFMFILGLIVFVNHVLERVYNMATSYALIAMRLLHSMK